MNFSQAGSNTWLAATSSTGPPSRGRVDSFCARAMRRSRSSLVIPQIRVGFVPIERTLSGALLVMSSLKRSGRVSSLPIAAAAGNAGT